MTFQSELDAAARGLALLAVRGTTTLTDAELDVALYARATVLDVAYGMTRDLTGIQVRGLHPTLADLETHAVGAFTKALRAHQPVPARRSPSDVLTGEATTPAGKAWRDVARHAFQAHHLWQTGNLPRQEPDVAWTGVRDAAALASVVAELDGELAQAAAALPGREQHAGKLAKAATSGLATAARAVAALADSGPLAPAGPEPVPAPRREIVPVLSAQEAIAAQEQLAALLRSARHIRPERVALITLGHQRTIDAVLRAWSATDNALDRQVRAALRDHRDLLADATGRRWRAASITGGDPFPLHQAQTLRQRLHTDSPVLRGISADPALRSRFVHALAETTTALADVTDAHLRTGAWLHAVRGDDGLTWTTTADLAQVPAPTQALRAAAIHAQHLRASTVDPRQAFERILGRTAPGHRAVRRQPFGARHTLAPAPYVPLLPQSAVLRPARPGVPPRPVAPFHVERQMRR